MITKCETDCWKDKIAAHKQNTSKFYADILIASFSLNNTIQVLFNTVIMRA